MSPSLYLNKKYYYLLEEWEMGDGEMGRWGDGETRRQGEKAISPKGMLRAIAMFICLSKPKNMIILHRCNIILNVVGNRIHQ